MKYVLIVISLLVGFSAGVSAGIYLRPPAKDGAAPSEGEAKTSEHAPGQDDKQSAYEYVKMNNQFVVPVVNEGNVTALVVLSLSLEVGAGQTETIYNREPKLRDLFLEVLFDHANLGGFDGAFTEVGKLRRLRDTLRDVAIRSAGDAVHDVLILDIARQEY